MTQTKTIQNLKHNIEEMRHVKITMGDQSALVQAKSNAELKLFEAKQALSTLEAEAEVTNDVFSRKKEYHQTLMQQYHELQDQKIELEKNYREKDSQGDKVDYLNELIAEAKKEKYQLQEEYDKLVRKPFFQKEVDNTNYRTLEDLKEKLDKSKRETEKARGKILQHNKDLHELEKEKRDIEFDKEFYGKELKRISTIMDPNGISGDIVAARLRAEDKNAFRDLMDAIKYTGDDPGYEIQDTLDQIRKDPNPDQPEIVKQRNIYKREVEKKQNIVLQLRNQEEILRSLMDMQKAETDVIEKSNQILNTQIRQDKNKIDQMQKLMAQRAARIKDLQS